MHGASFVGDHVSRARSALKAGCNLILACNDSDAAISILDALEIPNNQACYALAKMKHQPDKFLMPLKKNPIWIENQQKLMQFVERI